MANFEKALKEELKKILPSVFPLIAREGTPLPYIVYKSSYGQRDYMLEGYTDGREIEFSIQVVSADYSSMWEYTNNVIDNLLSLAGNVMGEDGIPVLTVTYEQPDEMVDPITKERHSITDFKIRI